MRGRKGLLLVVAIALAAVGAGIAMIASLPDGESSPVIPAAVTGTSVPVALGGPRRMPVSGSDGYVVVVEPDGVSYLEGPGVRRLLAGPASASPNPKIEPPPPRPRRRPVGRLVVTDTGVVDVPRDAVVTLVGRDRVVAHNPDGSSTVYHVDGRVEEHSRWKTANP